MDEALDIIDVPEEERKFILTIGYQKRKPWLMAEYLQEYGVTILADVRFQPRSQHPYWRSSNLKEEMRKKKIKYKILRGFGNENYKGDEVKLYDPDNAMFFINHWLEEGEIIALMCKCEKVHLCHRSDVCDYIDERLDGVHFIHL